MAFYIVLHNEDGSYNSSVRGFASIAEAVSWRAANAMIGIADCPIINEGDASQARKLHRWDRGFDQLILA